MNYIDSRHHKWYLDKFLPYELNDQKILFESSKKRYVEDFSDMIISDYQQSSLVVDHSFWLKQSKRRLMLIANAIRINFGAEDIQQLQLEAFDHAIAKTQRLKYELYLHLIELRNRMNQIPNDPTLVLTIKSSINMYRDTTKLLDDLLFYS